MQFLRRCLGIEHLHVPVAPAGKSAAIDQAERRIFTRPARVFFNKLPIRKSRLGVFIEIVEPGMRGKGIEIKIAFFYILAAVALIAGKTESALF